MRFEQTGLSRRNVMGGLLILAGLAFAGCGRKEATPANDSGAARPDAGTAPALAAMTVYRDPSCGCCTAWAEIARNAGYVVRVIDHPDMPAIKRQYGVPDKLLSCHTTIVDGYAVEGHVPIEDVKRLLAKRPAGIKGIAVAGMPLGSPGMEVPDGTKQTYEVMAFGANGRISTYRSVDA